MHVPSQVGGILHIKISAVEFSSQVCSVFPLSVYPGVHITSHVSISLLVHGNSTNPLSGGVSSGHNGGSHIAGRPVHTRIGRQLRLTEPLKVYVGSQE